MTAVAGTVATLAAVRGRAPRRGGDAREFERVLAGVALDGPAAALAAMLDSAFLAEAGWDPVTRVLTLPADHPLLGRVVCRVSGCSSTARPGQDLCYHCVRG